MHPESAPIHATEVLYRQAAGMVAWQRIGSAFRRWFVTDSSPAAQDGAGDRIDWLRAAPFVAMHLACLAVLWVGVSPVALAVAAGLYVVRMFAITGTVRLTASKSSRLTAQCAPARRDMATRWMMALVEQPMAMATTMAFSKDARLSILAGVKSSQTMLTARRPHSAAIRM